MAENRVKIVIEADGKDAEAAVKRLSGNLNDFGRKADTARGGADRLRGTIVKLAGAWVSWNAAVMVTEKALSVGQQFVRTAADAEKLKAQLHGLTGSAQAAEQGFQWLRDFSLQAPIYELSTYQDAFVKFKAVGLDPTNGSLEALVNASAAFGKTGPEMERAVVAIQQMMGKGVVSMEELRQQLAEAIPTASQIMAREMGMDMATFVDAVGKGAVDARTGLNALFTGLKEDYDGSVGLMMDTWDGQMGQLNLNWQIFQQDVMDGGLFDFLKDGLKSTNSLFVEFMENQENIDELGRTIDDTMRTTFTGIVLGSAAFIDAVVPAIRAVGTELNVLWTGYQQLPTWAKEVGIAGAILGGPKGKILFGSILHLTGAVANSVEGLSQAWKGNIKWSDLATMDAKELAAKLEELRKKGILPGKVAVDESGRALFHWGQQTVTATELAQKFLEKMASFRKVHDPLIDHLEKMKELSGVDFSPKTNFSPLQDLDEKAEKERLRAMKRAAREIEIEDLVFSMEKRKQLNAEALKEVERQENEWVKKASEIDGTIFAERRAKLKDEFAQLSQFTDNKIALDIRYAQEKRVIDEEEYAWKVEQAQTLSEYIQARQEQDAFNLRGNLDNQRSAWEQYYQGIKGLSGSYSNILADSFSSGFFDPTTKQIGDLNESWDSLWSSMVATTIAAVAQIAAQQVVATAADWAMGAAGFVADAIFHTGTPGVKDDETVAVLQAGEMVIPRGPSQIIRDAWRESGGGTDWGSMFGSMAGMAANGGFSGGGWNSNDPVAAELVSSFQALGVRAATGVATNLALGVPASAMISSVAANIGTSGITGLMAGMLNVGLGNTLDTMSFLGLDFSPADIGSVVSALVGIALGGPLGLAASVVAGPLVGLAISGITDALDIRNYEATLDALEDQFGNFKGKYGAQAIDLSSYSLEGFASLVDMMGYEAALNAVPGIAEILAKLNQAGDTGSWGIAGLTQAEQGVVGQFGGLGTALGDMMASSLSGHGVATVGDKLGTGHVGHYGGPDRGGDNAGNVGGMKGSSTGTGGGYNDGKGGVTGLQYGGLVDSVLVPRGEDGLKPMKVGELAFDAETSRRMIDEYKEGGSFGGSPVINIQVVTSDGRILKEETIKDIKARSKQGVLVIHANGIEGRA